MVCCMHGSMHLSEPECSWSILAVVGHLHLAEFMLKMPCLLALTKNSNLHAPMSIKALMDLHQLKTATYFQFGP